MEMDPSSQQAPQGPPPPPQTPLHNLVRFLLAVASVPPGTPDAAFQEAWEKTAAPADPEAMQAAIRHLYTMPPSHLVGVLAGVEPRTRKYLDQQALAVADGVGTVVPRLSQAAAVLRWIINALPALSKLPEADELGTAAALRQQFAGLDALSQIARPDAANPTIASLQVAVDEAASECKRTNTKLAEVEAAAKRARTIGIVAWVILAVVVVIAVIVIVLLAKKANVVVKVPAGPGLGPVATGGVSRAGPTPDTWGFPVVQ
jgi:hypothetical protein